MTPRAQRHLMVLNALERTELRMKEAAAVLGLSVRQLRRLRRAYRTRGAQALVHGNRGRPSPRRLPEAMHTRIVTLARTTYAAINHQHLVELLAEREHLRISRSSLRRILATAGLRSPRRRRPPRHRHRRARMPQVRMLVQLDGSHHTWLQGRGPALVLLAAVDDATGTVLTALFREHEDAQGYLLLMQQLALSAGLPLAVYTDRHGIFAHDRRRPLTLEEQLDGGPAPTQVGRTLHELGIRWIPASSPQAKGRIERLFEAFQDRLLAELRLAHVKTCQGANVFLPRFLAAYNTRFALPPAHPQSAFRPWPVGLDPHTVFCFKYLRTVANDNTITLGPQRIHILPGPHGRSYAQARVEVQERLDGTLAVVYHGTLLPSHTQTDLPQATAPRVLRARNLLRPAIARPFHRVEASRRDSVSKGRHPTTPSPHRKNGGNTGQEKKTKFDRTGKPAPDHPWKRYAAEGARRKLLREAGVTFSLNT